MLSGSQVNECIQHTFGFSQEEDHFKPMVTFPERRRKSVLVHFEKNQVDAVIKDKNIVVFTFII